MSARRPTPPEVVADVRERHAGGQTGYAIARDLGLPVSTVYQLLDPDYARKNRARKARYSVPCIDCGARVNGWTPSRMGGRCRPCNAAHSRKLTRAWILDSFREWAGLFGEPPSAADWNPHLARANGMTWKAERYERTGRPWPPVGTVHNHFGSWNAGLEVAGFEPRKAGYYGRPGEDSAVVAETVRLYRSGLSGPQVAQRLGIDTTTVYYRLRKAGEPRRPRDRRRVVVA